MNSIEEWRPVPGFEGLYDVSSLGRLRSYWKIGWQGLLCAKPRLCMIGSQKSKYIYVGLQRNRRGYYFGLHQIVLLAFIGPRPFGHQGAHLNGQSKDNRLINLAYVTVSENAVHKKQHGTERNPSRKLGLSDVAEIRRMYATGGKQPAIAAKFGMSQQQISRIVNHRNWNYES